MSKHTPGPWTITGPGKYIPGFSDGGDYAIEDAAGQIIAEAIHQVDRSEFRPAEANARLIAAAPEMLEALRRSLSWLSSYPGEGAMGCYDQARAAIAKAVQS